VQFLMKALAIMLLLPLAIVAAGGLGHAFSNLPPGFFAVTGGPFNWAYILGFMVTMTISYNASWSLAQKYYSVRDEREASKAAYCAAALNMVGAPLMILPAIIGRNLLPGLVEHGRTADTYVLLVLKLLPVGMIGIIMAAMFSATMAMVSADFNAIASVLTKDVYHRLLRPSASERQLLAVGRWVTLLLGGLTTLLSIWIALTRQQSLFNIMVTVLGLFMAPTFLPLLAGLTVRRLTWQGAFTGFLCGLGTGSAMLAVKTWSLPHGITIQTFEGVSLLANAGMTVLGIALGTALSRRTPEERQRVEKFFAAIDTPIAPSEVPGAAGNQSAPVLGLSTIVVGLLLAAAAVFSGSATARIIDISVSLVLILIGILFRRRGARDNAISRGQ
jgi:SSS family solute:Na+ symporter